MVLAHAARPVGLVTGASMGLGEQLAVVLARNGHDVVVVGRSESRLVAVQERLRLHGVEAHAVAADLSTPAGPRAVIEAVAHRGLEVDVLVNNAGAGTSGPFLDSPLADEEALVGLNCAAVLTLTHHFASHMRARRRGRILNIASTAAFAPGPSMATYYATKAFVLSFSEALAVELASSGVTVTCSCPGRIDTGFARRAGTAGRWRPGILSAEVVAAEAYEALMQGDTVVVHGLVNWLGTVGMKLLPRGVVRRLSAALNAPTSLTPPAS